MDFTEKDCCVEHEGKRFCSGGAFVNEGFIIAYPKKDGVLGDWRGNPLDSVEPERKKSWDGRIR